MLFRVFQSIENDIWKVLIVNDPDKISDTDKKLMKQYGEPEINVGGTFLSGTGNEFTLPATYVKIRSDFPYEQDFDSTATPFDTNTQTKVEGWRDAVLSLIDTAITTLRANVDTFTAEITHQI